MAKISRRAVTSPSSTTLNNNTITTLSSSSSSSSSSPPSSSSAAASTATIFSITSKRIARNASVDSSLKYTGNNGNSLNSISDPLRNTSSSNNNSNVNQSNYKGTNSGLESNTSYTTYRPIINAGAGSTISTIPQHNKTAERERIRQEFFATYDVMTGVRIAATLSGFFSLLVFLIVWKSRSSSNETLKVLKDPKMAAVAAVCMQEEEEREIQEAMVATGMSIYPDEYDTILYRRQRMLSLGNVSAPPMLNRGYRFSSVGGGGYSCLLEPPRRFSYSAISGGVPTSVGGGAVGGSGGSNLAGSRRKSGSESSRILCNYPMGSSFGTDDYFIETEDELEQEDYPQDEQDLQPHIEQHKRTDSTKSKQGFLEVPIMGQDSRRSSAMTCCSTDSSYLERRCSAFTLGMSNLPPSLQRKLSTTSRTSSVENWDYYYPDIQVIQPTPKPTPCPSEKSIFEQLQGNQQQQQQQPHSTTTITSLATQNKSKFPTVTTTTTTTTAQPTVLTKSKNVGKTNEPNKVVRKHSIAYYDPESSQAGCKQQIHSISADTVNMYPYNQQIGDQNNIIPNTPIQSAPPIGFHNVFHFTDSPSEDLYLSMRRKVTVVELQPTSRRSESPTMNIPSSAMRTCENNNVFAYPSFVPNKSTSNTGATGNSAALANSSSISIDSTPKSMDKLNGSGSLGTMSGKALFNVEKRAPLASLSSFKISSIENQDSEMRSMDEDSVFMDSVADTDEDMQQLSSDSEEVSLTGEALEILNLVSATGGDEHSLKTTKEKRFGVNAANIRSGTNNTRVRRALLERHRTSSASSSDRVSLIGGNSGRHRRGGGDDVETGGCRTSNDRTHLEKSSLPDIPQAIMLPMGSVLCTNSPPMHPRRAQLIQQYSDPPSLPTTTTTTATVTTEEDTCNTLNTELIGASCTEGHTMLEGECASVAGGSTTYTQHSSLNTIVSADRFSSSKDTNSGFACSTSENIPAAIAESFKALQIPNEVNELKQQQLPQCRLKENDDPCASSISDSIINMGQQPLITMPSTLKNLIVRGTAGTSSSSSSSSPAIAYTGAATATTTNNNNVKTITISKSATNLSFFKMSESQEIGENDGIAKHCPSVMLELPLIKLPNDESSESSEMGSSDLNRDPSIPGTSRKWSKETLF